MSTVYNALASAIGARLRCALEENKEEWFHRHTENIRAIMKTAPSGSGIDCGTNILLEDSTENELVFLCSFHHMNDNGMYDGWTKHRITIKANLVFGIRVIIGGRNRNEIKDFLHQTFEVWLKDTLIPTYDKPTGRIEYKLASWHIVKCDRNREIEKVQNLDGIDDLRDFLTKVYDESLQDAFMEYCKEWFKTEEANREEEGGV